MKPKFLWREIRTALAPVAFLFVSQIVLYLLWRRSFFLLLASGCAFLTAFVIHFFRDPERRIPDRENVVLAPADGRVLSIESGVLSPTGEETVWRIVIFLSLWDVHVNRVPVSGEIDRIDYRPGGFLPAFSRYASRRNEQNIIRIRTDRGAVFLKQVAGLFARRIVCGLRVHQEVKAGERFGMIKFGSRVELFIPDERRIPGGPLRVSPSDQDDDRPIFRRRGGGDAPAGRFDLRVRKGCRVKAGETLIGEWTNA